MINRTEIKEALKNYDLALADAIKLMADEEINNLYENQYFDKARELAEVKYPLGNAIALNHATLTLIKLAIKDTPFFDADPLDLYLNTATRNRIIGLARQL